MSLYIIRTLFLPLLILHSAAPIRAAENKASKVQVTILVNEGLLIRSGNLSILVDAFTEARESEGDSKLNKVYRNMLAGRPPFSSIQLALVSHPHSEHFNATIAGTFLKNHPETILVSSPEIIQAIRDQYSQYPAIKGQLKAVKTNKGEMTSFTLFGIQVDFILFSHEASAFYTEQVLGHIIHLGGRKLFYIGDAEMRPDNWQPYDLKSLGIHIALVPYWLFKEKITRTMIKKHVAPKKVVVVQIPPKALKRKVFELSRAFPKVVFLSTAMASARF